MLVAPEPLVMAAGLGEAMESGVTVKLVNAAFIDAAGVSSIVFMAPLSGCFLCVCCDEYAVLV